MKSKFVGESKAYARLIGEPEDFAMSSCPKWGVDTTYDYLTLGYKGTEKVKIAPPRSLTVVDAEELSALIARENGKLVHGLRDLIKESIDRIRDELENT